MKAQTSVARLLRDRGGNFGMMTALLLPVLIGVGGMALDMIRAVELKNELQTAADSGALTAATAMANTEDMTEAAAMEIANKFQAEQLLNTLGASNASEDEKAKMAAEIKKNSKAIAKMGEETDAGQFFDVTTELSYDMPLNAMARFLGMQTIRISATGSAQSARKGNALSMYLVLDESGSMAYDTTTVNALQPEKQVAYKCGKNNRDTCYRTETNYVTKMASLKSAAAVLFAELLKAADSKTTDPVQQETKAKSLIRMGAISYTHETKSPQSPEWGTQKAKDYVNALPAQPAGGTDSSGAMKIAYNALKKLNANNEPNTEYVEQAKKKNYSFGRFIVLMTDGEMTGYSSSWNSGLDDATRKICTSAKNDGIKIFTVAFMAPARGKSLLEFCASDKESYFEPNNMEGLVTAFGTIARQAARTAARLTN